MYIIYPSHDAKIPNEEFPSVHLSLSGLGCLFVCSSVCPVLLLDPRFPFFYAQLILLVLSYKTSHFPKYSSLLTKLLPEEEKFRTRTETTEERTDERKKELKKCSETQNECHDFLESGRVTVTTIVNSCISYGCPVKGKKSSMLYMGRLGKNAHITFYVKM